MLGADTAKDLYRDLPFTQLILILREPVSRAFSEYHMKLRRVQAQLDLAAVEKEEKEEKEREGKTGEAETKEGSSSTNSKPSGSLQLQRDRVFADITSNCSLCCSGPATALWTALQRNPPPSLHTAASPPPSIPVDQTYMTPAVARRVLLQQVPAELAARIQDTCWAHTVDLRGGGEAGGEEDGGGAVSGLPPSIAALLPASLLEPTAASYTSLLTKSLPLPFTLSSSSAADAGSGTVTFPIAGGPPFSLYSPLSAAMQDMDGCLQRCVETGVQQHIRLKSLSGNKVARGKAVECLVGAARDALHERDVEQLTQDARMELQEKHHTLPKDSPGLAILQQAVLEEWTAEAVVAGVPALQQLSSRDNREGIAGGDIFRPAAAECSALSYLGKLNLETVDAWEDVAVREAEQLDSCSRVLEEEEEAMSAAVLAVEEAAALAKKAAKSQRANAGAGGGSGGDGAGATAPAAPHTLAAPPAIPAVPPQQRSGSGPFNLVAGFAKLQALAAAAAASDDAAAAAAAADMAAAAPAGGVHAQQEQEQQEQGAAAAFAVPGQRLRAHLRRLQARAMREGSGAAPTAPPSLNPEEHAAALAAAAAIVERLQQEGPVVKRAFCKGQSLKPYSKNTDSDPAPPAEGEESSEQEEWAGEEEGDESMRRRRQLAGAGAGAAALAASSTDSSSSSSSVRRIVLDGTKECWQQGTSSDIRQDFLYRGMYLNQILRYRLAGFKAEQLLVLTDKQLRECPYDMLQAAAEHIGIEGFEEAVTGLNSDQLDAA